MANAQVMFLRKANQELWSSDWPVEIFHGLDIFVILMAPNSQLVERWGSL